MDEAEANSESFWSRDYKNEDTRALTLTARGDAAENLGPEVWSGLAGDVASMVEVVILVLVKVREGLRDTDREPSDLEQFIDEIDGSFDERTAIAKPVVDLLSVLPDLRSAEDAYAQALDALRSGKNGNAIANACGALETTLASLGYAGASLPEQAIAASNDGNVPRHDATLLDWVSSAYERTSDTLATRDDAWLVVHASGALILRLVSPTNRQRPALQRQ